MFLLIGETVWMKHKMFGKSSSQLQWTDDEVQLLLGAGKT